MSNNKALRSIADFTKNVTGASYRDAVKNENRLGEQLKKVKSADATLLKQLLHTKHNSPEAADLQRRMDIVESTMQKKDKAHSAAVQAVDTAKANMTKARKQLAVGGATVAGLVGASILAKKLHDKKKEKNQEKTAFQELDEMVKMAEGNAGA